MTSNKPDFEEEWNCVIACGVWNVHEIQMFNSVSFISSDQNFTHINLFSLC